MINNKFKITLPILFLFFLLPTDIHAQTLGLSISPPIDEIMIIPGREVTQTFTITNDGNDGMASIYIIPFKAQGENGNVALDEKNAVTSTSPYASWFSLVAPITTFGEKFYMAGGQRQDITIKISPSENASEKDYYFTLLYELDNEVPGGIAPSGPTSQARIGANLILSLSANGSLTKSTNIVEFSAPKIIDSLGTLDFNIRIGNYGSYFFKPDGSVTINPTFGKSETLKIAPFNVISDSVRNIPCIKNEEVVPCKSANKVLIGIYKSTLSLTADGQGTPEEKTVTTIAFPFSIVFGLIIVIMTYRIFKSAKNKVENPLDNAFRESNNKKYES